MSAEQLEMEEAQQEQKKKQFLEKNNKNILVVAKNTKQHTDLLRFVYQWFVKKDNGKGFYDERLRVHLGSIREVQKRQQAFDIYAEIQENKERTQMTPAQIEMHLLHKLNLLLEQKTLGNIS